MTAALSEPVSGERSSPEERYFNRELSWLAFNERVLAEAANPAYPLVCMTISASCSSGCSSCRSRAATSTSS
jgi:hypothetical protein